MNKGLKAAVGAVPVLGSAVAEFFNFVVADPAQERRDDFMRETFNRLCDLQANHDTLSAEALRDNEQFQVTVVQAMRISAATASGDKERILQNAIINSAIGALDENIRHVFMQMIDEITPMHAVLLRFWNNPSAYPALVERTRNMHIGGSIGPLIQLAIPDVKGQDALVSRANGDLQRLGLADTSAVNVMMTPNGMMSPRITDLGRSFLSFISDPD